MITQITLHNVSSYTSKAVLRTNKKINLIYGLNGVGKTTLSNYLSGFRDWCGPDGRFANCEIQKDDESRRYEFLVFNTKFIERYFVRTDILPGLYTLSERNPEILEKIEKKEDETRDFYKTENLLKEEKNTCSQSSDSESLQRMKSIDEKIDACLQKYYQAHFELEELRDRIYNYDAALERINRRLSEVGLDHLRIVKFQFESKSSRERPNYKVERNGCTQNAFSTLCEAEKMMLSFLFFVEMCKSIDRGWVGIPKKIIVIDDPISSMSNIFVYNVARIIAEEFTAWNVVYPKTRQGEPLNTYPYEQVFILTHNLYFMQELVERDWQRRNELQQLFRIYKKNSCSYIRPMKFAEINNDYQSFWAIVNGGDDSNKALLANSMRQIVEHFFGLVENLNLNGIFRKRELQGNEFQSFYRFINRGSHSDLRNISSVVDFDYDFITETFKRLFIVCGYEKHYNIMMKICNEDA